MCWDVMARQQVQKINVKNCGNCIGIKIYVQHFREYQQENNECGVESGRVVSGACLWAAMAATGQQGTLEGRRQYMRVGRGSVGTEGGVTSSLTSGAGKWGPPKLL